MVKESPRIDPRLAQIDNALYRISVKAIVVKDNKVLLVREKDDDWWSFPGGGIDYGESIRQALAREVAEELGVKPETVRTDGRIAFVTIGAVVNGVPRASFFYRVDVPVEDIKPTDDVLEHGWFTLEELEGLYTSPSTHGDVEELRKVLGLHNMDEQVDIIDETGNVLKQTPKAEAHKHGELHKTVIGYLKYGNDWALVKQAADRQDAGQLVAPVGGHVKAGESEIDALLRESEEEIGTRNITYKHIGDAQFHRQVIGRDENHLFVVYEISTDDPITLNEESVAIERFTSDELKQALADHPENFGEAYYFVLEKFYPEYLPKNWQKRWGN